MAKASIGPRLQVDGEEQYRAEIKQIIEQAKTLDAQMAAVTASFDKNTTAEEKAAKQSKILTQQVQTAQKRVDLLRDMVDKAAAATGDNSEATLKWKQALYGAEEQLGKLQQKSEEATDSVEDVGEAAKRSEKPLGRLQQKSEEAADSVEDLGEAMEDSEEKSGKLGDQVSDLAGKLGIQLPDGAIKALNGFTGLSTGAVIKLGLIATAATAVIETVKRLNQITDDAATKADDLLTQSSTSGLSTDMLQQIKYAAPYIDVEASTIISAMEKIGKSAYTADNQFTEYIRKVNEAIAQGKSYSGELGEQAVLFNRLGVAVVDSNDELRSAQDIFWDTIEALNQLTNETERDAIAQKLLGNGWSELKPLAQNLEEAQRLFNEAQKEGYVRSKAELEILSGVDDAHNKLTQTIEKNRDMIAVQWAPATQAAYEAYTKWVDKAGTALIDSKLIENGAKLVEAGISLVDAVTDVIDVGAKLVDKLPTWLNPIKQVEQALYGLSVIVAAVADGMNLITGIVTFDWNKAGTALGLNASKGQYNNVQKLHYSGSEYVDYTKPGPIPTYNAAGTDFFQGGGTWVGEAGPEYVQLPRGSRIYSNEQSRALMAGGDTVYNITVQNVEELDEIIDWYQSRRIRERMG